MSTGHGVGIQAAVQGVVADIASQAIVACEARKDIVPAVANDDVVQQVPSPVDVAGTRECQVLDVGCQRVADARLNAVCAFARVFGNAIALVIHDISVIARIAGHGVRTRAAV